MNHRFILLAVCAVAAAACSRQDAPREPGEGPGAPASLTSTGAPTPAAAIARMESKSGSAAVGEFELTASDGGVSINGSLGGLTPGTEHGFHVHENGDCSAADASSAGAHFNPGNAPHGAPNAAQGERHLGDMPNLVADENGHSAVTASVQGATLRDGGPNDLIGKALVVHEKRDDYVTQPSGDSGARIACGVIR
jgi:Cu-Zn family superoxide dismutase